MEFGYRMSYGPVRFEVEVGKDSGNLTVYEDTDPTPKWDKEIGSLCLYSEKDVDKECYRHLLEIPQRVEIFIKSLGHKVLADRVLQELAHAALRSYKKRNQSKPIRIYLGEAGQASVSSIGLNFMTNPVGHTLKRTTSLWLDREHLTVGMLMTAVAEFYSLAGKSYKDEDTFYASCIYRMLNPGEDSFQ